LDPELLRTDNNSGRTSGGGCDEDASSWVSFGSAGAASTVASTVASSSGEERDDAAAVHVEGRRGGVMTTIATTLDGPSMASNTGSASSPSFLTTTDQSFDVTPPIHRTFLADADLRVRPASNGGAPSADPFGITTNIEESPPVTFTENAFAEAAFTVDGSEEVEVSRFDITIAGPSTASIANAKSNERGGHDDDAPRDGAPAPTSSAGTSSRVAASSSANNRPDWSDVTTWMRAPIDAITDAVVTPVLPPRFDAASGPTSTTTSASTGAAADDTGAGTASPLPPRQRGGGANGSNTGTPTIRPPRPSGTRVAAAAAPGASPMTLEPSSDQTSTTGGTVSPSPSTGAGAAERRRSAARRASSQGANATGVAARSPRRLGLGRSASNTSSSSSATGTTTQDNATGGGRSPVRNPSMNASSSTPRSTPTRGRSSSRVRSSTSSSRGRSTSRTRGSAPSTPSSSGRSRRGRSVNRGGTPGSGSRGRSASRKRTSTMTSHRSSSRTPSSRMTRGVPSSPSAQSTGGLSRSAGRGRNSGRQNRGRTRSVSRTRRAPPESPSASSTGGLSRRGRNDSGNDGWNIDLDDVSFTSEPANRAGATGRSGRSRNLSRGGSGALNAGNLRSLDLEGGGPPGFNRSRAGSGSVESSSATGASTNSAAASSSKKHKASLRREGGLIEKLFGDTVSSEAKRAYLPSRNQQQQSVISSNLSVASGASAAAQPEAVHTRTLLTASVYHNQATGLWIATINTNQKPGATNRRNAAKYLKAFSFHTEREARESAYANAPPKMVPFTESPNCFICRGKFAVFRRPSHCRNCGVCICTSCTTAWSSKMIPETYNMKKESSVKVCKSCNFLVLAFRRALLDGQYDEAIALYNTGNINLRCPFGNIKGNEAMYPIHCAAEGGNLDLLRWLVDVHFCPISLVRTGNKKPEKENTNTPIVTSKGRSVLNIAMSKQNVEMMRYLVSEKSVSVYEIKDLSTSLKALEAVLISYPSDHFSDFDLGGEDPINFDLADNLDILDVDGDDFDDDSILSDDDLRSISGPANTSLPNKEQKEMDAMSTAAADACIICYDNSIDCVMTPCGHQICCLKCSAELANTCPVCNSQGQFIRIFKP